MFTTFTEHSSKTTTLALTFSALSEPNRLLVLRSLLTNGAVSVGRLARATNMSDALMSQHLKVLYGAHLVVREKHGKNVYYKVDNTNPLIDPIESMLV